MKTKDKSRFNTEGIIDGALSLTVATLIVKLLGVLYKIPLANILGDEGMGYFNSAYTVYSFFYILCTAGVPKSVMILISERLGKGEENSSKRILKIALRAFFVIGFCFSLLLSVFSIPLSSLIGNKNSYVTMIFVAPSIIFSSVAGVLRGYLSAKMKFFAVALSQIVEGSVKLGLGLCLALLGVRMSLSLYMISALTILGATVGSFAGVIFLYVMSKEKKEEQNIGQNEFLTTNTNILSKIFKISLPITLSAALMSISGLVDLFLIIRRLEFIGYTTGEATALYGNYSTLAVSMFNLALSIITPVSVTFIPYLTKMRAKGDFKGFADGINSALSISAVVSAPITLGLAVYSKEILSFLFGEAAANTGAPLLLLVCPGIFFMSVILILNSGLEALNRPSLATLSMIFGVIVKIIVSGMLLGRADFGISGAPIGTVISYALSAFISLIIISNMLGYCVPVLSSSFLSYLLASIAVLSSRLIYSPVKEASGEFLALMAAIVFSALIYIALSLFCGSVSRKKILKMAKSTNLC